METDEYGYFFKYLPSWSQDQIKNLVDTLLTNPCPDCGSSTEKLHTFHDLDIVCSNKCGWKFPVDTGPLSLGRRVE